VGNSLRSIYLTVEETTPGQFFWRLVECKPDGVIHGAELNRAPKAAVTYRDALRSGFDAFDTSIQGDPIHGPRKQVCEEERWRGEIGPRQESYKERLIEVFCSCADNGRYFPSLRVHIDITAESAWSCPIVPLPPDGFADLEDAFDVAFTTAEFEIDGKAGDLAARLEEG
jgi:hypothetical protein